MKKHLTLKIFFSLLVSFLVIIGITVSLFYVYFNYFYQDEKINRVIDRMNTFSDQLVANQWSGEELYNEIIKFNQTYNMELNIYDYGENSGLFSAKPNVMLDNNQGSDGSIFYYLSLKSGNLFYDLVIKGSDFDELTAKIDMIQNTGIFIEGYIDENNYVIAEKIGGITLKAAKAYLEKAGVSNLKYISQEMKLVSTQEVYNIAKNSAIYQSGAALTAESNTSNVFADATQFGDINFPYVADVYLVTKEREGINYTLTENPYGNNKQINFTKQINQYNRMIELYTYISLQSIDEVVEVIIKYIPVFLLMSFLLAMFIALIFSRTVTKPILNLSHVADRMANMDLDIVAQSRSNDELSVLAMSLNTLAYNLKGSMGQLREQNEQLETKYELKQQQEGARKVFVANVSHELKTPLGIIKSYMEAIKDGVKIEKQQYYMDVILDEISKMDDLIVEMLTLSKFDEGMILYSFELFDADLLVKDLNMLFDEQLKISNLKLEIKTPLGCVFADKEKIYQTLTNLVSNAVKYATPSTTIRIESIQINRHIEFYIHNECTPFTEEELEKVWERFYKIDASHNRDIEGSGIGLTIVKSILEGHKAKYGVYNTSKGVCFYFQLPVEELING